MFSDKIHISQKLFFISLTGLILLTGCVPTRRIQEGEYLLRRSEIDIDKKNIEEAEIKKYEKQTENRKILGLKFHLFLYNLASPKKEKFPSKWFREIGEAPVIWDPLLTEKTSEQFQKYLQNKGYYDAHIEDTTILKKKSAIVEYHIKLNEPVRIKSIRYQFEDKDIAPAILEDTLDRLINTGDRFDKELLQKERLRIEGELKNKGYYKFLKEFVFFEAREGNDNKKIDLTILIKDNVYGEADPVTKVRKHRQYKINDIYIYPNYNQFSKRNDSIPAITDTVVSNYNYIIYSGKHFIKPYAVIAPNLATPGTMFNQNMVKKTYNNYISLDYFRIANIHFKDTESDIPDTSAFRYLDSFIELSPRKRHAFTYEIVGTISSRENRGDNLGAKINITYNNYNFLGGAEHLQLKLTGAAENLSFGNSDQKPTFIRGVETIITFPKFIAPFRADKFTRKYNPKTTLDISYNHLPRESYTSTSAITSFGYIWKGNTYNKNVLIPLEFSYIWLPTGIDSAYFIEVAKTSQISRFYDHAITAIRYQFEFSNQNIEKLSSYFFLRLNAETAGNLLHGILDMYNTDKLFNVNYFQYFRTDIDLRYNNQLNKYNKIVYRLFAGVGVPYGNNDLLPFEKMYACGDVNGVRAWAPNTLGPGNVTEEFFYTKNIGDVKLEANIEYRYDLFWKLEGALFLDAGNIWTINDGFDRPEAEFKWNKFYNDLAIGTGLGLRFDLTFLLIRTDFGFKLRDPEISQGSMWIDANKTGTELPTFMQRWLFQFALGYPF